MKLILALLAITAAEHIAQGFITDAETWYLALGAKYLSLALALTCLAYETRGKDLFYRSIIALAYVWTWVDFLGHCLWQVTDDQYQVTIISAWSGWLIYTILREYEHKGDKVSGGNVFIMLLRPTSVFMVCKALVGCPIASVCLYANGTVWSYRAKTNTFDLYPVDDRWLQRHIAINTGVRCSDQITEMLDDLVGQSRWPGIKCIWSIRHVLARLGKTYKPRLFDYLPGIYAMHVLRGRQ